MTKIYNEIVIDMNPESSTFEKTLYEDSFEYNGDMMHLQRGRGVEGGSGGVTDTEAGQVAETGNEIWVDAGSNASAGQYWYFKYTWNANTSQWVKDTSEHGEKWLFNAPMDIGNNVYAWGTDPNTQGDEGATILPDDPSLSGESQLSIGERDIGMGDVSEEEMLNKKEGEMLEWIIDTRYGGQLPDNISEHDILTQIRTKLPRKEALGTTDWYGIQDTAEKVGSAAASVYGGMAGGMRKATAGMKQIGKDVYGLKEKKGKDWMSKFRTFLSSLPSATGTGN